MKVFKDNKSSFVAGQRYEFTRMFEEIRKRNVLGEGERIDGVYVYTVSRLARNFPE